MKLDACADMTQYYESVMTLRPTDLNNIDCREIEGT